MVVAQEDFSCFFAGIFRIQRWRILAMEELDRESQDLLLLGYEQEARVRRRLAMSMKPQEISPVPEETARVARAANPKGNTYMLMRDELGSIYENPMFVALFPRRGQPAEAPWRLALVTVMQYMEGLSDRQTAEAVRERIDWKYALSLELSDPGFDFVRHVT